jgi:hypothetical protein
VIAAGRRASLPWIENTGRAAHQGDAVELANGATVENLVIGPAYRGGIYGADVASAIVRGNDLSATNSSCTTGFVVQPFKLPTLVPGVGLPFASGLSNGWAAIMVDATRAGTNVVIDGNRIHDADCADGIDIRASGTARATARIERNVLTGLHQGPGQESLEGIGLQTTGTSRLTADVSGDIETDMGAASPGSGNAGLVNSDALFANSAGRSSLTAHLNRDVVVHDLGGFSSNGMELVSSNGGPRMSMTITGSTFRDITGDILEAVNLSRDAIMKLAVNHVTAAHSEFIAGPAFHQVEPGDDGDCLFELAAGAASSTAVKLTNSLLTGCVTDGLEVASVVADGIGPVTKLGFDVRNSRITGNALSNLRVATSSPVSQLDGRIQSTDLSGMPGSTPIILENIDTSGITHERLDFGGGPLGSAGGNCIYGGGLLDLADVRDNVWARHDWLGPPSPGRLLAIGGNIDSAGALAHPPPGIC